MDVLISILGVLKSPRTSVIVTIFCLLALFAPYDALQLSRSAFVENYQAIITTCLFLALSVLALEAAGWIWKLARLPIVKMKRIKRVNEIFQSLNLDELCVLYVMTQMGTKVIKGSFDNHAMISLRQKGALFAQNGTFMITEWPHVIPSDLFEMVAEQADTRFPPDFRQSPRFEDEVRNRFERSTTWRSW
jgi:hypothetical protein